VLIGISWWRVSPPPINSLDDGDNSLDDGDRQWPSGIEGLPVSLEPREPVSLGASFILPRGTLGGR
jgi:hypothetical protein